MPSSREVVANKALSGLELREIIRQKLETLMDNEGLLTPYVGYGRIGFTLTLKLHLDNMMRNESEISISTTAAAVNQPELAAMEPPPLADPSPSAVISAQELDYRIDSPNEERLRHGLPVTLDVRGQDGTVSQQTVTYPRDEGLGDGQQKVTDVTPEARANWKK